MDITQFIKSRYAMTLKCPEAGGIKEGNECISMLSIISHHVATTSSPKIALSFDISLAAHHPLRAISPGNRLVNERCPDMGGVIIIHLLF